MSQRGSMTNAELSGCTWFTQTSSAQQAASSLAPIVTLWVGPLPLPQCREADQQALLQMLLSLRIIDLEVHERCAYVTVPASQAWQVRVCITNRAIRHGPRLSARERVDSAEWVSLRVSPLEVAFSQGEISDRLGDDEVLLEELVDQTQLQRLGEGWLLLLPPFAPMRVAGDGHRFVSFDNQLLYVLQRKAVQLWPRPCVADVLICDGQVPSEYWAILAMRCGGDSVILLSCLPAPVRSPLLWGSAAKWQRKWAYEDAIADKEYRQQAARVQWRARENWTTWETCENIGLSDPGWQGYRSDRARLRQRSWVASRAESQSWMSSDFKRQDGSSGGCSWQGRDILEGAWQQRARRPSSRPRDDGREWH